MKTIRVLILLTITAQTCFCQQDNSGFAGVYMTKQDFINNHLSWKIKTGSPGYKLEFPPIADWALTIKIVTPDSVRKFKRGEVYGYCDNGAVFRYAAGDDQYVPQDYYRVLDARGIVIYKSEFNGGGEFFYSIDFSTPIHRLSFKNLKEDYKSYPQFLTAIKDLKKEDVDTGLGEQDRDGNYTINKIYVQTVKR